jgi:hypothetical protein
MKDKLKQFIKRNKIRNSKLYQEGLVEGVDYVICPVSKERLLIIRSDYINNVLGMTVEEYDNAFPNAQKRCQAHKENIKKGLHQKDSITGLTKYQISQQKAKQILSTPDQNGITGYQKKGQKTRATHMSKIDQFGRNGYARLASKAIIKGNNTKAVKGLITLEKDRDEFYRYKLIVLYLTEKYRKELTQGYITGLAGIKNAWHIDHQFSILKGYQLKISPFIIGHRENLKMIPWKDNIRKHSQCSIRISDLLSKVGYTSEKSNIEFQQIIKLINDDIKNSIPPNAAYLLERFYGSTIST